PKWSARVGGQWVSLKWFGPAGEALSQSAALYEGARDGHGNIAAQAWRSASAYVAHVEDETWLRGVKDAFDTIGDVGSLSNPRAAGQAGKDLSYRAGDYGSSFVPQHALGQQA